MADEIYKPTKHQTIYGKIVSVGRHNVLIQQDCNGALREEQWAIGMQVINRPNDCDAEASHVEKYADHALRDYTSGSIAELLIRTRNGVAFVVRKLAFKFDSLPHQLIVETPEQVKHCLLWKDVASLEYLRPGNKYLVSPKKRVKAELVDLGGSCAV